MNKTLNVWYLVRLLIVVVVCAGTVHLLHHRQAGRQAGAFSHQAELAEQAGDLERAARYLRRYLLMRSDDVDARARMGMLMDESATTAEQRYRAFEELEEVFRESPGRDDVGRRIVAIAMDPRIARYADALNRIEQLLATHPEDGGLYDLKGQCLTATGQYGEAKKAYFAAIERAPDLVLAHWRRALLLRSRLDQADEADKAIGLMLEKNGNSAQAHVRAARYFAAIAKKEESEKQVREAQRCDSEDADVILLVADGARAAADELLQAKADGWFQAVFDFLHRKVIEQACAPLRQGIDRGLAKLTAKPPRSGREEWDRSRGVLASMFITLSAFESRLNQSEGALQTAKRGVENLPERPELRLHLIDVCIAQRDWDLAGQHLEVLQTSGFPEALVQYDRGRMFAGQEEWPDAIKRLEDAAEKAVQDSALAAKINFLLGNCYDQVGLIDQRYEAYRRALPADPNDSMWFSVSMRLAESLTEMRRTEESIKIYERVGVRYANALLPLAQLLLQETVRLPEEKRNWAPIEAALGQAPDDVQRELVRADVLLAKKLPVDARDVLNKAAAKFPEAIEPWAALAYLDWRLKQPDQAAEVLAKAEQKFGDKVLFRIIRARMISAGNPAKVTKALEGLLDGADKLNKADRRRLLAVLAEIAQTSTDRDFADRLWARLAQESPHNLGIQLIRFDNAMQANDEEGLTQAKDRIVELDRRGGSARMAQVLYLIWRARQKSDLSVLPQAHELLVGLERLRPGWSRVPLAEALIFDLEQKPDLAIGKYRQAVDLGERNPDAIRRLVELYFEQRQYGEADAVMRRLPEGAEGTEGFTQVAAEVSLQTRNFSKALELSAKAVPEDSKDYRKLLWRGRVLWLAGSVKDAEKPFLQARTLAPEKPDAWIVLVQYYVSTNRKPDAERILAEAQRHVGKSESPLTLAQCYELLGSTELARRQYDEALKFAADDLRVLKSVASFKLRTATTDEARREVQSLLEQILNSSKRTEEDVRFVRTLLAITMLGNRDYDQSRGALVTLGLLDEQGLPKPLTGRESPDEILTRAIAFGLQRDLKRKRDAIRILEDFGALQPLPANHQFLLAQLHNAVGDWLKARAVLMSLLRTKGEDQNPLYVRYFAAGLLRQPDVAEAEVWVSRLEKLQPDSSGTIDLRARLLAASGKSAEARDYLFKQAEQPDRLALVARLLEEIGAGPAAEPLYKKLVAADKRPEAVLRLVAYYGRQDRLEDALSLCDTAWKTANPEAVSGTAVEALYAARQPKPAQIEKVLIRVRELLSTHPRSTTLLSSLAALQNLRGDYSATIASYRQVIVLDPKDRLARNNMAYLLSASEGKHDEALSELEHAKQAFGQLPMLLDTEAQVQINKQQWARAIELLDDVVAQEPTAAHYFHLAQAHFGAKQNRDARIAWAQAKKIGLKLADLHQLERTAYQNLESESELR